MVIEVLATVDREHAIFMAGESCIVKIILKNMDKKSNNSLAWGCVQLHCDQVLSRSASNLSTQVSKLEVLDRLQNASESKTAVSREKQAIYSSKPSIIFCDIFFPPQEVLCFESIQEIPLYLPPSFKGHFVKYSWFISVAVQHVDAPIKMLQLPIKVINATVDVFTPETNKDEKGTQILNPFISKDEKKPSVIEILSSKVEGITSSRSYRVFEITSGNNVFAAITMFKSVFKLGDDIIGRMSFPHKGVHCLQVLVKLETVEVNLLGDKREEKICSHFTEHYMTAFVRETHFKVSIPLTGTPSFSTEAEKTLQPKTIHSDLRKQCSANLLFSTSLHSWLQWSRQRIDHFFGLHEQQSMLTQVIFDTDRTTTRDVARIDVRANLRSTTSLSTTLRIRYKHAEINDTN